jgi:hypothetical protein
MASRCVIVKRINPVLGKWRILEMEMWDRDYIDLIVPGHITFEDEGDGSFHSERSKAGSIAESRGPVMNAAPSSPGKASATPTLRVAAVGR